MDAFPSQKSAPTPRHNDIHQVSHGREAPHAEYTRLTYRRGVVTTTAKAYDHTAIVDSPITNEGRGGIENRDKIPSEIPGGDRPKPIGIANARKRLRM